MRRHIFVLGIILTSIYSINAIAAWPTKPAENIWTNSGHTTLAQMRCGDCCSYDCWLPNGTYYNDTGTFTESCTGEPSEPTCNSSNGTYSVVNGQCKLLCDDGYYLNDSKCTYCDKNSLGWDTVEIDYSSCFSYNHHVPCTSVDVTQTSCECRTYADDYINMGVVEYGVSIGENVCSLDEPAGGSYIDFDGVVSQHATEDGLTELGTWSTDFSVAHYGVGGGIVKGIASCNSTTAPNGYYTPAGFITDEEFHNTVTGGVCWCKMTYPVEGRWVYDANHYTEKACADGCASNCLGLIEKDDPYFRMNLIFSPVE